MFSKTVTKNLSWINKLLVVEAVAGTLARTLITSGDGEEAKLPVVVVVKV
jgi:hypothetical protein